MSTAQDEQRRQANEFLRWALEARTPKTPKTQEAQEPSGAISGDGSVSPSGE